MKDKAVLYVRVSSKEQEREGFSIPAQKKYLSEYAVQHGFSVVKVFEEAESAKIAGRTQFKAMVKFLDDHEDVQHLLVEKTDRLYRNLKDYNLLDPADWPHLSIHLAKENEVLSKESKSHQKLIHGIKVLMAKNYSDNLSEEVQKGMSQKALQGLWPSCAPLGYTNNRQHHTIEPDAKQGAIIARAFELASRGDISLSKLKKLLFSEGLRSSRSKSELSKSQMKRVLSNPIYHGDFIWKGILYNGKHEPLVSKELFDRVQVQMGFVKRSKLTKFNFAFTNTMTCGHCGSAITAQEKRKKSGLKYIYYHCASGKEKCEGITYIRQEKIDGWISGALSQIEIPEHIIDWTKQALLDSHKQEREYHENQIKVLESRYRTVQNKINKTYEDKLEGQIDSDFWALQNDRLNKELVAIESQMASLRLANAAYVNKGVQLMELARQAPTLFKTMTPDEKRELVNLVLSNPRIENGSLCFDFRKPFSMFVNVTQLDNWRGIWNEYRTWCRLGNGYISNQQLCL